LKTDSAVPNSLALMMLIGVLHRGSIDRAIAGYCAQQTEDCLAAWV
jgi:hypothetical protein